MRPSHHKLNEHFVYSTGRTAHPDLYAFRSHTVESFQYRIYIQRHTSLVSPVFLVIL